MVINKKTEGTKVEFALSGRLDTSTAPNLEAEVKSNIGDVKELVFDFKDLEYISSAGLRVLLSAQKIMNNQGSMVIRNANEGIMDIFDVTGFCDIITIE